MHNWGEVRLSRQQLVISSPLLLVITHIQLTVLNIIVIEYSQSVSHSEREVNNK